MSSRHKSRARAIIGLVARLVVGGLLLAGGSCVFTLGDVVEPGAGGGGMGGDDGGGGAGDEISTARRVPIDLDATAIGEDLDDVVALVALTPERLAGTMPAADGSDLRFFDSDETTLLAHEIERWSASGTSIVWVKLPSVTGGATKRIWMHVGEEMPPAALTPTETWTSYAAVYHFADSLAAGAVAVTDATSGSRDGTATNMSDTNETEARFGQGYLFQGMQMDSAHVDMGDDPIFETPPGQVRTMEIWYRRDDAADDGFIFGHEACCLGWSMQVQPAASRIRTTVGVGCCAQMCCGGTQPAYGNGNAPIINDDLEWHHMAVVINRQMNTLISYIDGVEVHATTVPDSTEEQFGDMIVGASFGRNNGFLGPLDEFRISTVARSAAWLAFNHGVMTGALVTYGTPERLP